PGGDAIAFQSDESGHAEIYVQAFPEARGSRTPVSLGGGTQARWRRDGTELFYIGADNRMMVVKVTKSGDGQMAFGTPTALFQTRTVGLVGILRQQYVVSPDATRFLINISNDETVASPITVLLNWRP